MTRILKSKPVTDAIAADLAHRVERLKILGIEPTLAIVRVGSRPDDLSYERTACKRAKALGLTTRVFELDEKVSQEKLLLQIRRINADSSIHGCLVFRPLPSEMEDKLVCDELAMAKDIDGVSAASLGAVFTDAKEGFAPSTAEACVRALDFYDIPVEGKHVVVVGRSLVVGKPVAMLLLRRNASVTICHSRTKNLKEVCARADILVAAVGRPGFVTGDMVKPGAVVIDVGMNRDENGKLCGDVDYENVREVASAITPVPGGVGPMTIAMLMTNTVEAVERRLGL